MTTFIDQIDDLADDDVVTVVIPEYVVRRWWEYLLHNQSALWLKARLRFRPNTIVVSVPLHASPIGDADLDAPQSAAATPDGDT